MQTIVNRYPHDQPAFQEIFDDVLRTYTQSTLDGKVLNTRPFTAQETAYYNAQTVARTQAATDATTLITKKFALLTKMQARTANLNDLQDALAILLGG